ncbi:hypothetical protein JE943_000964 [Flavobacterium psychrophilum]|nr:hypothetical protein [Flavobacterium psychrophilum]
MIANYEMNSKEELLEYIYYLERFATTVVKSELLTQLFVPHEKHINNISLKDKGKIILALGYDLKNSK